MRCAFATTSKRLEQVLQAKKVFGDELKPTVRDPRL